METRREEAVVGLFVLSAAALFLAVVFVVSGTLTGGGNTYRTYFDFAAGLEAGQVVRYGGIKSGRIRSVQVDPENSSRVEVVFQLDRGTPVKTDSVASIASLGPLGDIYLEISPGGKDAPRLPDGSTVPSEPYIGLNDVVAHLDALTPEAEKLLVDLNQTVLEMKDLLNEGNRGNVAASLAELRSLLEDSRPKVSEVLSNMRTASSELSPLLEDLRETTQKADELLAEVRVLVSEGGPDAEQTLRHLRDTSESASRLVEQLNQMFIANSGGIDQIIDNLRIITENLEQFTDLIKTRPASLIRSAAPEDRKPGEPPKK